MGCTVSIPARVPPQLVIYREADLDHKANAREHPYILSNYPNIQESYTLPGGYTWGGQPKTFLYNVTHLRTILQFGHSFWVSIFATGVQSRATGISVNPTKKSLISQPCSQSSKQFKKPKGDLPFSRPLTQASVDSLVKDEPIKQKPNLMMKTESNMNDIKATKVTKSTKDTKETKETGGNRGNKKKRREDLSSPSGPSVRSLGASVRCGGSHSPPNGYRLFLRYRMLYSSKHACDVSSSIFSSWPTNDPYLMTIFGWARTSTYSTLNKRMLYGLDVIFLLPKDDTNLLLECISLQWGFPILYSLLLFDDIVEGIRRFHALKIPIDYLDPRFISLENQPRIENAITGLPPPTPTPNTIPSDTTNTTGTGTTGPTNKTSTTDTTDQQKSQDPHKSTNHEPILKHLIEDVVSNIVDFKPSSPILSSIGKLMFAMYFGQAPWSQSIDLCNPKTLLHLQHYQSGFSISKISDFELKCFRASDFSMLIFQTLFGVINSLDEFQSRLQFLTEMTINRSHTTSVSASNEIKALDSIGYVRNKTPVIQDYLVHEHRGDEVQRPPRPVYKLPPLSLPNAKLLPSISCHYLDSANENIESQRYQSFQSQTLPSSSFTLNDWIEFLKKEEATRLQQYPHKRHVRHESII